MVLEECLILDYCEPGTSPFSHYESTKGQQKYVQHPASSTLNKSLLKIDQLWMKRTSLYIHMSKTGNPARRQRAKPDYTSSLPSSFTSSQHKNLDLVEPRAVATQQHQVWNEEIPQKSSQSVPRMSHYQELNSGASHFITPNFKLISFLVQCLGEIIWKGVHLQFYTKS